MPVTNGKKGIKGEGLPYNIKMRNLFGDLIEASAITIMKASGIEITDVQKQVKLGDEISGTLILKLRKSMGYQIGISILF